MPELPEMIEAPTSVPGAQATRELARFIATTSYADLPAVLLERARVYVLDNLAAGFVGSAQPWSHMVSEMVRELGGAEQASIFHRDWRADISRATLVNGVMMGGFESEHIGHVAHPSATVFPAALAVAERDGADGRTFLLAMLLGYEVVCRVGEAQTRATEIQRGFHNPGVNGAFGAAAASGKLLGLDEQRLAWALGIAGSHACGLVEFAQEGAMTKRAHPGRAAQLGVESALLARGGFTGPTTILEGRYGYLQAYSPSPQPERLVADLGREWLAADLTIKAYPCHATSQAVVHALQQFSQAHPFEARTIRRVRLLVDSHATEARYLDREPRTMLGAQYSLPFTVAVALTRGLANPHSFEARVLEDTVVRDLAKRIEIETHDTPPEVLIELPDGTHRLPAATFPGATAQPLDFDAAANKLQRYAGPLVGETRVARLVDLVARLDQLDDVRPLAASITT
jgi:2-methylcitrate dehydratase PrpD